MRDGSFGGSQATLLALRAIGSQQRPRSTGATAALMLFKGITTYDYISYSDSIQYYLPQTLKINNNDGSFNNDAGT
jgi:hypothetical protein